MSPFSQASFIASVGKLDQLPPEGAPEIVFAGRSNVGKSSAINILAKRHRLAFVSKTPGRTQTINFYDLGMRGRLVDLPGYGYARVPHAIRSQWDELIGGYLRARTSLAAVVLIMDARQPCKPKDMAVIEWIAPLASRILVLLSKSDKLSRAEGQRVLGETRHQLGSRAPGTQVRLFSSVTGEGVDEVRTLLERWLTDANRPARNKKAPGKGE